jgi:hypothetical protein
VIRRAALPPGWGRRGLPGRTRAPAEEDHAGEILPEAAVPRRGGAVLRARLVDEDAAETPRDAKAAALPRVRGRTRPHEPAGEGRRVHAAAGTQEPHPRGATRGRAPLQDRPRGGRRARALVRGGRRCSRRVVAGGGGAGSRAQQGPGEGGRGGARHHLCGRGLPPSSFGVCYGGSYGWREKGRGFCTCSGGRPRGRRGTGRNFSKFIRACLFPGIRPNSIGHSHLCLAAHGHFRL